MDPNETFQPGVGAVLYVENVRCADTRTGITSSVPMVSY